MKKDVQCTSPQETARSAAEQMRKSNVGFLPVCDEARRVIGTLTDRDLAVRVLAEGLGASTPIQNIYSREVVACRPENDLQKAEALMAQHQKSRICCVDVEGRLVGVISLTDLVRSESASRAAQMLQQISHREARA
jgi:CBS domain-containing protein